jgi:hypothetical protein
LADETEIRAIMETPGGRERIAIIIKSTAVAFAVDNLHGVLLTELDVLKRQLTEEELQLLCNVLWQCLFKHTEGELDRYVEKVASRIAEGCGSDPVENIHWC